LFLLNRIDLEVETNNIIAFYQTSTAYYVQLQDNYYNNYVITFYRESNYFNYIKNIIKVESGDYLIV